MREIFVDMKDKVSTGSDYKSCIKFVGRCEELLTIGQFDIEGNDVSNKFRVAIHLVLTHDFHFALESFTKKFHKMRWW